MLVQTYQKLYDEIETNIENEEAFEEFTQELDTIVNMVYNYLLYSTQYSPDLQEIITVYMRLYN